MIKKFALVSALAIALSAPGLATASVAEPTSGDTVTYEFVSDVPDNQGSNWYDADNDMSTFSNTHLPKYNAKNGHYWGTQSFTSRSTYQLTAASIQTSGYYAQCFVSINGVQVSENHASGKYAMAVC
ncbi:hypothetical protein HH308_24025 [Gordonia sp. TBRC 11910]|uniref:Uncharacterized protein n=1 Tax=Gordonia asplenii TaxID=2725283 RepID=A0A848L1F4_9ACTN|nr:hypothetical protein [Gordonia asplenii]NMO04292.1 hypothetical protein [Gordonia asplenii]